VEKTENAVGEALRKAHGALLADLRELEQAVRPTSLAGQPGKSLAELRARLGATHAHVTEHFRFEEQDGYMEVVRKREPRLERTIEQLADEHRRLRESLDALIAEAKAAKDLGESLREKILAWIERVRQHEIRENKLVQTTFNLDIIGED
jgi:hypothetical protein